MRAAVADRCSRADQPSRCSPLRTAGPKVYRASRTHACAHTPERTRLRIVAAALRLGGLGLEFGFKPRGRRRCSRELQPQAVHSAVGLQRQCSAGSARNNRCVGAALLRVQTVECVQRTTAVMVHSIDAQRRPAKRCCASMVLVHSALVTAAKPRRSALLDSILRAAVGNHGWR